MKLSDWLAPLFNQHNYRLDEKFECQVSGIINDNREVKSGDCFIALPGLVHHGREFIDQAINNGAVAVLLDSDQQAVSFYQETQVVVVEVQNLSQLLPDLLAHFYNAQQPNINQLQKCAVTGTNGKSSVAGFVAQLAKLNQNAMGLIGTLGRGVWPELQQTLNTTPELTKVLRDFAEMQKQGAQSLVMEVSSHGISQGRVAGIEFDCAVFTNLSRDHLDYHQDMDSYYGAKRRLFLADSLQHAVINIDDEYGRKLFIDDAITAEKLTYGFSENANVKISDWSMQSGLLVANIQSPWGDGELVLALAGPFNLANALAAICVLALQGYDFTQLLMQASQLQAISGRMETYLPSKEKQPTIVVDFAHTPDALANVLQALKAQKPDQLAVLFGCGGDRDQGKRQQMGEVADQLADQIWLTADNPRSESAQQIIEQIEQGITTHNAEKFLQREQAIAHAVTHLESSDVLLLAGKGHEQFQEIDGVKHVYSDAQVIADLGYRKAGSKEVAS